MKQFVARAKSLRPRGLPNLRNLRQRKGLSLSQLADLTGLRRATITQLENGSMQPEPSHLRLLAKALEVPTFELVS